MASMREADEHRTPKGKSGVGYSYIDVVPRQKAINDDVTMKTLHTGHTTYHILVSYLPVQLGARGPIAETVASFTAP